MFQAFTFLSVLLGLLTSPNLTEPAANSSTETSGGGESGGDAGASFDPNG